MVLYELPIPLEDSILNFEVWSETDGFFPSLVLMSGGEIVASSWLTGGWSQSASISGFRATPEQASLILGVYEVNGTGGEYTLHLKSNEVGEPVLVEYENSYQGYLGPDTGHIANYEFYGSAGDEVWIGAWSDEFDGELWVMYGDEEIAYSVDYDSEWDPAVFITLPDDGFYTIVVGDYGGDLGSLGGYFELDIWLEGQVENWRETLINGNAPGDNTGSVDPGEVHIYTLSLIEPARVTLTHVSTDYDAYLQLFTLVGDEPREILFDDDGFFGLNSQIVAWLPQGEYLFHVRPLEYGDSGS